MAEEEIEEKEEETEKSKKFPLKLIIIAVVVILFCAGGSIIGFVMMKKGAADNPEKSRTAPKSRENQIESRPVFGRIFPMEVFVVNLAAPDENRYLKTKMEFELSKESSDEELNARLPQLRDIILLHLSSKSLEDIQGTTGKIALRNELIMRLNQSLKNSRIRNLYFTEFVVQ